MKFNIVVATHHKTGTVWMSMVFRAIARRLGANYVDFWSHYDRLESRLVPPFILFNHDSAFRRHAAVLRRQDLRILHLIRDPRDVLISAMHYHRTSNEPWLREHTSGSMPYQQKLNAFSTLHEQYVFELENATGSTIEAMLDWQYDRPNCRNVRYEDLWRDRSMTLWSDILAFLGFEQHEVQEGRDSFWQHSLFGDAGHASRRHARSGETAQWKTEFTPALAAAFLDHFPDALQILGYETDDRWVEDLPAEAMRRATTG